MLAMDILRCNAMFKSIWMWCVRNRSSIFDFLCFSVIGAIVFMVWRYGWIWVDENVAPTSGGESPAQARGLFGDKFGSINALFSGLAFAGIILTLLLQRRELSESRREVSHQQFDNTFFSLLRLHVDITSKLSHYGNDGRKAFFSLYERIKFSNEFFPVFLALQKIEKERIRNLKDHPDIDAINYPELSSSDISNVAFALKDGVRAIDGYLDGDVVMHERIISEAYGKVAVQSIDDFAHYYRNLYHILRFVDQSNLIKDKERIEYIKFVRAQLSDVELVTIFYNSLTTVHLNGKEVAELGYPKMTRLLMKYDILQNMNPRSVIHPIHLDILRKNSGDN